MAPRRAAMVTSALFGLVFGAVSAAAQESAAAAAAKLKAAELEALPRLYQALAHAQAAGVPGATAQAKVPQLQAAADLALFAEVAAVAGGGTLPVTPEMQQMLHAVGADPGAVLNVMQLAENAGVPAEELAAARRALDEEFERRLMAARSALEASMTPQTMEDLARIIHLAHELFYDADKLQVATQLYEQKLQIDYSIADDLLLERALHFASHAAARVPESLARWVEARKALIQAAQMPVSMDNHAAFVAALRLSEEVSLPQSSEIDIVRAAVVACMQVHLNQTMDQMEGETDVGYAERLAEEAATARESHLSDSLVSTLSSSAQIVAAGLLQQAAGMGLTYATVIRRILELAERLDLPAQDRLDARAAVQSNVQAALSSAVAAASGRRLSAAGSGPDGAAVKELALAIKTASDLDGDQAQLLAARQAFAGFLVGDFQASDVDHVIQAAAYADHAGVNVPLAVADWNAIVPKVKFYAASGREDAAALRDYVDVLQRAKDVGLPAIAELTALGAKAQTLAAAALNAALASMGSIEDLLPALEIARLADVPLDQLAAAESTLQDNGLAALVEVNSTGSTDIPSVYRALDLAERAGISSEDIDATREAVFSALRSKLELARASVQTSCTPQTVKSLALALHSAQKLGFESEELEPARLLYASQVQGKDFGATDLPLVEMAVHMAGHAGVYLDDRLRSWAELAGQMREALVQSAVSTERLLDIITQASSLNFPATDNLAAVKAKAQAQASAELDQVVSDQSGVLQDAIDVAVSAGISQTALDSAQAVLNAQAPSR